MTCADCGFEEWDCRCGEHEDDELECTHCGGDGICDDGADPLWRCQPEPHHCHACKGTGKRRDQVIF